LPTSLLVTEVIEVEPLLLLQQAAADFVHCACTAVKPITAKNAIKKIFFIELKILFRLVKEEKTMISIQRYLKSTCDAMA
jgi:hypothetical protein